MRGLTVRQPWAWAIIHGQKDVENRSRSLGPYRGPVAIHAGLTWDGDPYDAALRLPTLHRAMLTHRRSVESWVAFDESMNAARGHIIGVVDLIDTHKFHFHSGQCSRWADPALFHLLLRNPRPLATPIPWRGALGLWTVPADLEAAIREQVTP